MSSFVVLSNGTTSLTVDRPPILVERFQDRGRQTAVASSVSGQRIVTEYDATPTNAKLVLKFTLLDAAQAETLAVLLDAGGIITTRLKSGGTPFYAVFGPREETTFDAVIGDHPDSARDGSAINSRLTWQRAQVTMYKM